MCDGVTDQSKDTGSLNYWLPRGVAVWGALTSDNAVLSDIYNRVLKNKPARELQKVFRDLLKSRACLDILKSDESAHICLFNGPVRNLLGIGIATVPAPLLNRLNEFTQHVPSKAVPENCLYTSVDQFCASNPPEIFRRQLLANTEFIGFKPFFAEKRLAPLIKPKICSLVWDLLYLLAADGRVAEYELVRDALCVDARGEGRDSIYSAVVEPLQSRKGNAALAQLHGQFTPCVLHHPL